MGSYFPILKNHSNTSASFKQAVKFLVYVYKEYRCKKASIKCIKSILVPQSVKGKSAILYTVCVFSYKQFSFILLINIIITTNPYCHLSKKMSLLFLFCEIHAKNIK